MQWGSKAFSLPCTVALAVLVAWLGALGCQGSLPTSLDGKACTASGECLPGYVCDHEHNVCVKGGGITYQWRDRFGGPARVPRGRNGMRQRVRHSR